MVNIKETYCKIIQKKSTHPRQMSFWNILRQIGGGGANAMEIKAGGECWSLKYLLLFCEL